MVRIAYHNIDFTMTRDTTMQRGIKVVLAAVAIIASTLGASPASAYNGRGEANGWHVRQPTRFMVSGVLRKNGTTDVIKPIQAIVVADASESAVKQFSRSVANEYPGYTLIATVASPVPTVGTCENAI